jgi:hypothetical protein
MNSVVFLPVTNNRIRSFEYDLRKDSYAEVEQNQAVKHKQLSTMKSFGIIYV